jgi:antitoxin component of RelBE/YafQ-DinJ toxin-antitoxin module
MKKEEIKIRITSKLKNDFKRICDNENTTMSNKIHGFIYDKVEIEKTIPIRVSLVKSISEKILTENLFEDLKSIKNLLEEELKNGLNFKTNVSEFKKNGNITFGDVYFKINDNDEKPYILTFSIVSTGIIYNDDINTVKDGK